MPNTISRRHDIESTIGEAVEKAYSQTKPNFSARIWRSVFDVTKVASKNRV